MIGLLFFIFLGAWFFLVYKISRFLVLNLKNVSVKPAAQVCIFILIFFAPVADEIIGGIQFKILCNEHTFLIVDEAKVRGKTVASQKYQKENLTGYILPVTEDRFSYKDTASNEILISWNVYRSDGGLLSRSLNLLESTSPYIFRGTCISPQWKKTIFSDLNVNVIYK